MVYVFLADGFEEIEALAPIDILRRADIEVCSVGITGTNVCGGHNISVKADILPENYNEEDVEAIILPGGLGGTENMDNSSFVKEKVEKAFNSNKLVCAICAAPMILGKMGVLNGKKATCYPGFEKYFEGATYVKEPVCRYDNIITSNGMGSAVKFALEIVSAIKGSELADKIKNEIQC